MDFCPFLFLRDFMTAHILYILVVESFGSTQILYRSRQRNLGGRLGILSNIQYSKIFQNLLQNGYTVANYTATIRVMLAMYFSE
jgi:hypothetical protein